MDTKTIESFRPGLVTVVPFIVPDYYYNWWEYYNVAFVDNGYTGDVKVAYVETNLYDVKSEKLIWTGHSETDMTEGEQQLITAFVKLMIKKIESTGLII